MLAGCGVAALALLPNLVPAFYALGGLHPSPSASLQLSCAMLGALMAALGLVVWEAARVPALVASARRAVLLWFVIDSGLSCVVAPWNVLINVCFLAILWPPLRPRYDMPR